jgi:hypothetical protein
VSGVDEVVARLSEALATAPSEVWVITTEFQYEAGELVGVAGTLEKAKEIGVTHVARAVVWSDVKTNTDSSGKSYTWVEGTENLMLSLEEVQ